ncbi:MAG: GNAT family N-acetyltransferase [Nitrososphaerales archaeon]|nr:GNAT family N-acetyltransferase [Nitrososphaerales archaeon]
MEVKLVTRELSLETWPDFERLFEKPGEWGGCWCMYYQRPHSLKSWADKMGLTREERIAKNREDKLELVKERCSHGILVYAKGEPVGWCQYGPKEELPRVDAGRKYKKLALGDDSKKLWRITCFVVDRKFRRKGVATAGLKAALRSMEKKGGGLVEGYPAVRSGALAVWFGTVSMFEREGFKKVAPFGRSNVLMRRSI